MSNRIEDGSGKGYSAKVNSENRLLVQAVQTEELVDISENNEDSYVFASGDFIAITTTGTETGIMHVKNTSAIKNLYIYSIRSCSDKVNKWKLYYNSTGGTLISNQTAGSNNNLNLLSSQIASADVYKGADGVTLSGGTMLEHWINDIGHSEEKLNGALILGRNDSIELTVELDSAGDVCCRVYGYYKGI